MKLAIYGHGGSQNHGNEAIVRGVRELFLDADLSLYTHDVEADRHFGLDEVCTIKPGVSKMTISIAVKTLKRVFPQNRIIRRLYYSGFYKPMLDNIEKGTIYLLEAGDQYCEVFEHRDWYKFLNSEIKKRGGKTVMMSCTINPELFGDKRLIDDLNNYDLIVARESLTYEQIIKHGISTNVKQAPCPAFAMKLESFEVPSWVNEKRFIGINVGFLAQGNEKYYDILITNYYNCIKWVLDYTNYDIALIPHVNWNYENADFKELDKIERKFRHNKRIHYVEEHNAPKQKFIISKCFAFVCLRTHAVISALEASVPTVITGYKTKSKGIARDVFLDKWQVLADVQSLTSEWEIRDKLKYILDNREDLMDYSKKRMPDYLKGLSVLKQAIIELDEK